MSDSKEIVKQKFIEHFLFDYTDKDEFEIQMLSEIFEGIYYQKDKHFKPESKYWQVFRCLQDQQVEINQHQLEIHALGEANLNQAMMLAKKQEEIDNLKAQLNNMEACYIEKKKQVEAVSHMLEGDLKYVEQDRRGNFEFLQMAMIRCLRDDIKALRGEHENTN